MKLNPITRATIRELAEIALCYLLTIFIVVGLVGIAQVLVG